MNALVKFSRRSVVKGGALTVAFALTGVPGWERSATQSGQSTRGNRAMSVSA